MKNSAKSMLAAARGDEPADFVIKGARVANLYAMEYEAADVAVCGDRIVGVGSGYEGRSVVDGAGKVLIPGMIDGHVHIESSMLAPPVFAGQAVLRGTTAVMADPHEIANVMGMKGVEYMYGASRGLPLDVFLGAPSCVPASGFESPFENLDARHIAEMFERGWCGHLGEAMNFPGVINGDGAVWDKLSAATGAPKRAGVPLTGHAPGVRGRSLCAYMLGGISSDHECTEEDEALEKLRRGMWVMMRAGSSAPNLNVLVSLVKKNPLLAARCMAVSDDVTARDLVYRGHMDEKVRTMVREGLDPLLALRTVTLSPAEYFGLRDRGAIGPGMLADMVLVDSLESCEADKVWKNGRLAAEGGRLTEPVRASAVGVPPAAAAVGRLAPEQLRVKAPASGADMYAIGVEAGAIVTKTLRIAPTVSEGYVTADAGRGIAKIAVQERHRGTGRFAVGFVSGMGITRGAIASSVAHDAHNFAAVGMDDRSIAAALGLLAENGGGLAVTCGDETLGYFPLPVAGLMSELDAVSVAEALSGMEEKAAALGAGVTSPFMTLSFLSLSVIPELKITDRGYVDISKGGTWPLFTDA